LAIVYVVSFVYCDYWFEQLSFIFTQELARLWEKMRQRNIVKEERSKYLFFLLSLTPRLHVHGIFLSFSLLTIFSLLNYLKRIIAEAILKMKGKIPEIASSHVSSRVLQVIFCFLFVCP
jgi:pumilio family protein 6